MLLCNDYSRLGLMTVRSSDDLDRETTPFYNLTITVSDISGKKTTARLNITVLDMNDNAPIFSNSTYKATIVENQPPVTVVSVMATDADQGSNKDLTYRIMDGNIGDVFTIDSLTGKIRCLKSLDREEHDSYVLKVVAEDKGIPSLQSQTRVEIDVVDQNDNSPQFVKVAHTFSVYENSGAMTNLGLIDATDLDSGENGRISYSIETSSSSDLFIVNMTTGELTLKDSLDYESTKNLTVKIWAKDSGVPSRNSSAVVTINVLDINDNPPEIDGANLNVVVNESTSTSILLTVRASDKDSGSNSRLSYVLLKEKSLPFSLNKTSGELSLVGSLDREYIDQYSLHVVVSDHGSPSLKGSAIFLVNVSDANDNAPKFLMNHYEGMCST